jgi:hypothetical protein
VFVAHEVWADDLDDDEGEHALLPRQVRLVALAAPEELDGRESGRDLVSFDELPPARFLRPVRGRRGALGTPLLSTSLERWFAIESH